MRTPHPNLASRSSQGRTAAIAVEQRQYSRNGICSIEKLTYPRKAAATATATRFRRRPDPDVPEAALPAGAGSRSGAQNCCTCGTSAGACEASFAASGIASVPSSATRLARLLRRKPSGYASRRLNQFSVKQARNRRRALNRITFRLPWLIPRDSQMSSEVISITSRIENASAWRFGMCLQHSS